MEVRRRSKKSRSSAGLVAALVMAQPTILSANPMGGETDIPAQNLGSDAHLVQTRS